MVFLLSDNDIFQVTMTFLSDKEIFQVTMTYLLGDNNMGSSAEDGNGGDDGEGSEDDEAKTVQNLDDHYCHDGHQV